MKRIITIMLVVILSCNFVLCAYADEPKKEDVFYDEGVGGDQTIYINGIEYSVVYNGGYVVSCGDSSVTLSDFQCLVQLQQVLKKGGSINSYKGTGQAVAAAIGAILPTASKWGGALWNALNAVGDTKIKGTVNTDKTSDNYGAVTYDSAAVKQIYDLLKKQYLDSMHMTQYSDNTAYTDKLSSFANVYSSYYGNWGLSETTYVAYMNALTSALQDAGCDLIIATNVQQATPYVFAADTSAYEYLAYSDGIIKAFDADCNVVENAFYKIDMFYYMPRYDTTQNALDYAEKVSEFPRHYAWSVYPADMIYYFNSVQYMIDYANGDTTGAYITSDFSRGTLPSSITLTPDMLAQDWDKFTDELTDAITDALKGADSNEKQDKIDETFERYLKKINSNIEDLNADNNKLTKKSNKLLDDILDKVKDINKDTNKYLKGIQKDYLKDIKNYCKDMKKSLTDIAKNVKSIKRLEELNTLLSVLNSDDTETAKDNVQHKLDDLVVVMKNRFPMCIFVDMQDIYNLLITDAVAPVVSLDFGIESIHVHEVLELDFSVLDEQVQWFKGLQVLCYIFVLFKGTRKIFMNGGEL